MPNYTTTSNTISDTYPYTITPQWATYEYNAQPMGFPLSVSSHQIYLYVPIGLLKVGQIISLGKDVFFKVDTVYSASTDSIFRVDTVTCTKVDVVPREISDLQLDEMIEIGEIGEDEI